MKYLLIVFILLLLRVDAQKYKPNEAFRTNWKNCDLRGKVKKVTTKSYFNIEGDSLQKIWRIFTTDSIATGIFHSTSSSIYFDSFGTLKTYQTSTFLFHNNSSLVCSIKNLF